MAAGIAIRVNGLRVDSFDQLAVGPSAVLTDNSPLQVAEEKTVLDAAKFGVNSLLTINPPGASATFFHGAVQGVLTIPAANGVAIPVVDGGIFDVEHNGTGTLTTGNAVLAVAFANAAGGATNLRGMDAQVGNFGAGTVTNLIGSRALVTAASGITTTMRGFQATLTHSNAAGAVTTCQGGLFQLTNSAAGTMTTANGSQSIVIASAGTITTGIGATSTAQISGSGSITTPTGFEALIVTIAGATGTMGTARACFARILHAGGTITTAIGVGISNWTMTGPAPTNVIGLDIDATVTGGTTENWSIRINSPSAVGITPNVIHGSASAEEWTSGLITGTVDTRLRRTGPGTLTLDEPTATAVSTRLIVHSTLAAMVSGIQFTNAAAPLVPWTIDHRGTADIPNNRLAIFELVTERFTIASGGNVGIGAASPDHTLDVRGEISIFGASAALARLRLRGFYAASPSDPPASQTDIIVVDTGAIQVLRVRYNDAGVMKVGDLALV